MRLFIGASLVTGFILSSHAVAQSSDSQYQFEGGTPWQSPGTRDDTGYWFEEFNQTLALMQSTYWNGTYWPTTIQWIGAFLDTLLAASEETYLNLVSEHGSDLLNYGTDTAALNSDIQTYWGQIRAYYGDEDVIQIFDAAYDDAQWVVLEWLEAIKFINQYDGSTESALGQDQLANYAHRAHIFYNIVQDKFNTSLCDGGLTWNPALAPYKNAITNELFMASSVGMYLYWPGDSNSDPYPSPNYTAVTNKTLPPLPSLQAHDSMLLNNAIEEYAWFKSHNFTNAQGLIVDGFHISPNQTTCDERSEMVYTYNQGVILSGLRGLFEATADMSYLADGYALIDVVINATGWDAHSYDEAEQWSGLGRNGIMEDYCDAAANCSQDSQSFKGEYFHHLDLFCQSLSTTIPSIPGVSKLADNVTASQHEKNCASYTPWIEHNAAAALSTKNSSGIIGGWWGASYVNHTQSYAPQYAETIPYGAMDVWNDPWMLDQPPWSCQGQHCAGNAEGWLRRRNIHALLRKRQDINSSGRGRTVETEGSGLSVVKAVLDFNLRFS